MTPLRLVAEAGTRRVLFGSEARAVVPIGRVTRVPGLPSPALGITLFEGRAVLVLELDPSAEPKLGVVCDASGEVIVFAATRVGTAGEIRATEELDADRVLSMLGSDVWTRQARRRATLET